VSDPNNPTFGEVHWDTIKRWLHMDPAADGPVWMVNLMQYKEVAEYHDGRATSLSGKEADDAYAPLGPLAAVGAIVAFHGDVLKQVAGTPRWDRVAIVRYPSRSSFFAMQQRDDFKKQYEHKEAGMAFTIVGGFLPDVLVEEPPVPGTSLVMRVQKLNEGVTPLEHVASSPYLTLLADGVVVGDDRTWDLVRFDWVTPADIVDMPLGDQVADEIVLVVERAIDELAHSVNTSPPWR